MMYCKIHQSYRTVVAICDSDLLGKRFQEGEKQLEITKNFYEGDLISYKEAVEIMRSQARENATFNLVGKESIKAARETGIIDKEGIGRLAGVPYALVLL